MAPQAPEPRFRSLRQEVTDLPNLITLARILMVPLILVCIDNYSRELSVLAASLFLIAAVTDLLDGYLARRMGLVTIVGKFLDPLADKLIVLSTLVMLAEKNRVPGWLVVVLMARELAVTGLRAIASQQGFVIAAGAGGKVKSAFQMTGITFLLVHFDYPLLFVGASADFHVMGLWLVYISLLLSVTSAFEYFWFFAEAANKQAEEMEAQGITRSSIKDRLKTERAFRRERRKRMRSEKREARREKVSARRQRRGHRRERSRKRRESE